MLEKPESCKSCPLYSNGYGWVPDQRVPGAKTEVVLPMPELSDLNAERPVSWGDLDKHFFPLAGEDRETISISHIIRCRWGGATPKNPLPPAAILKPAVEQCRALDTAQESVTLKVAVGDLAWQTLAPGVGKLDDWRGFLAPPSGEGPRTLGVKHPFSLKTDSSQMLEMKLYWGKVKRFHSRTWPLPLPPSLRWQRSERSRVETWLSMSASPAGNSYVVIDTEYTWPGGYLTMVGLYAPGVGTLQWMRSDPEAAPLSEVISSLRTLVGSVTVVFHNTFADVPVLEQNLGIKWEEYKDVKDSMLLNAVLWSEQDHDLEYLASLYGKHEKMKHLMATDLWRYNEGDVVETANVWEALERQMRNDPPSQRVYATLMLPLIPIILDAHKRGIAVDTEKVGEVQAVLESYKTEAEDLAQAYCGYPISLGSPAQLKAWLTEMEGMKVKGVGEDDLAGARSAALPYDPEDEVTPFLIQQRVSEGAHPLIEARVLYAGASQLESHYVQPFTSGGGRIYPRFKPWTQANARWSVTDPPCQQLPAVMKPLIIPDQGWPWFEWDWSQAEPRLLAALSGDENLLKAFDEGWDLHTVNACKALGLPLPTNLKDPHTALEDAWWREFLAWLGKDDIRRRFGKAFFLRLCYGGDPRFCLHMPGARQMGLDAGKLKKAADDMLAFYPGIKQYWKVLISKGLRAGESRNFYGRRRRFLSQDVAGRTRELYNAPLQAGVSDIKNETIILIWNTLPRDEVFFVKECHDALTYAVKASKWAEHTAVLREIAQRPIPVEGQTLRLVADFHEKWPKTHEEEIRCA